MKQKIFTYIAFFGLLLVLTGIFGRFIPTISGDVRTGLFIVGFSLMLLGTIWKVVLEIQERED